MRVTTQMMSKSALNDLGDLRVQYERAQGLVAGKSLERPSEDPQAVVEAMDLNDMKVRLERSQKSGDDAKQWLQASEGSLTAMVDELQNAREIMVQAGSPANLEAGARHGLAEGLLTIRDALLREMNSQYRSQYIFSGYKTDVKPFVLTPGDPNGGVTYSGSSGEITRDIAPGLAIATNVPGDRLLEKGDYISILKRTADDLENGRTDAAISTDLTDLNTALNHVIDLRSEVGVRQAQVNQYNQYASDNLFNLEARLTNLTGGDPAKAVMEMTQAQSDYQAALSAFSKTMPMSLLDYMKG